MTKVGNSLNTRVVGAISYPVEADNARLVALTVAGMAVYNITDGTWTDLTDPAHPLTGSAANLGVLRVIESGDQVLTVAINGKDAPVVWARITARVISAAAPSAA